MNCQILFSGKNKKNIINLTSVEFGHRVVIDIYIKMSSAAVVTSTLRVNLHTSPI